MPHLVQRSLLSLARFLAESHPRHSLPTASGMSLLHSALVQVQFDHKRAIKNPIATRHIGTDAGNGTDRSDWRSLLSMLPLSRLATVVVVNAPLTRRNRHYTPCPRMQASRAIGP